MELKSHGATHEVHDEHTLYLAEECNSGTKALTAALKIVKSISA